MEFGNAALHEARHSKPPRSGVPVEADCLVVRGCTDGSRTEASVYLRRSEQLSISNRADGAILSTTEALKHCNN